jgi:N utilization substance protein B
MKSRRKAREAVLQALYQSDTLGDWSEAACDLYFKIYQTESSERSSSESEPAEIPASHAENISFARGIICGVSSKLSEIDSHITASSTHWSVARMARVDRNILRGAVFELLFHPQTPCSVVINEAIELAKRFGSDDSPMFVNGVLDHVARLFRPAGEAKPAANAQAATAAATEEEPMPAARRRIA